MVSSELSAASPEVLISALTSRVVAENPNPSLCAMAGEVVTVMWARALRLTIGYRK